MFFGLLDKHTGKFEYASAGHNPLVKLDGRTGRAELTKTKGFPLGMVPPEQFNRRIECAEISLAENDWLIQFTDGINEAINQEGEEFVMERFVDMLQTAHHLNPPDLISQVIAEHKLFTGNTEQFDDITLLAMKWIGIADDTGNNEKSKLSNAGKI